METGTGYIRVQVSTGDEALPIAGAEVTIKQNGGNECFCRDFTDENGKTHDFALSAPSYRGTLDPDFEGATYSLSDIVVRAEGFVSQRIDGIEVLDTQTAILPVHLIPLTDERYPETSTTTGVLPNNMTCPGECPILAAAPARSRDVVVVPDFIIVHLGRPQNAAVNVRVPFVEYIKNVASSEIYATWPVQSLRANIHAIVSFALNRVYT